MQRWTALIYTLLLAGAVVFAVSKGGPKGPAPGTAVEVADAGADGETADDGGGDAGVEEGPADPGSPVAQQTDAGGALLSGDAPPALGADAPKRVRFGVVLIQYRGAQGASPKARTRAEALELAKELGGVARDDFKAAIARGDKGSTEDLGYIPRGVLEPAPEYELFSLPKGGVGGPVDTPRGFWIVRRIE